MQSEEILGEPVMPTRTRKLPTRTKSLRLRQNTEDGFLAIRGYDGEHAMGAVFPEENCRESEKGGTPTTGLATLVAVVDRTPS